MADQPLYNVLRVTPQTIFDSDAGKSVDVQRVDFTVAGGGNHYVLIPNSDFDADKVEDEVMNWAAKIATVLGMEGPSIQMSDTGKPIPPGPSLS